MNVRTVRNAFLWAFLYSTIQVDEQRKKVLSGYLKSCGFAEPKFRTVTGKKTGTLIEILGNRFKIIYFIIKSSNLWEG